MQEIWLPMKHYEGFYAVSNYGRIYSYKRNTTKGGFIKYNVNNDGYYVFTASKNGEKKGRRVNVAVYETFIGNIPKGMHVNHKDEDKSNNTIWNLNLLTPRENNEYGTRKERALITKIENNKLNEKPICQYTLDGILIREYKSIKEAGMITGINKSNICQCVKGNKKHKTAGGYIWKYV